MQNRSSYAAAGKNEKRKLLELKILPERLTVAFGRIFSFISYFYNAFYFNAFADYSASATSCHSRIKSF